MGMMCENREVHVQALHLENVQMAATLPSCTRIVAGHDTRLLVKSTSLQIFGDEVGAKRSVKLIVEVLAMKQKRSCHSK